MNKGLKIFGILTSIGMLIVLMQGSVVTKTESGDGCGDTWPLCFGEWVPSSPALATLIEYSHRLVSGLVGLMVVILAIWAVKKIPHIRETKFWALMAVLFIIFQGLMGAAAVVFGHSNLVLALHFGISAISFATVVILTTLAFEDSNRSPAPRVKKGFRRYLFFVLAYTYAVIYSGAYVKHTGSTYACDHFPHCGDPATFGFQAGVHMTHRIAAIALVVLLLILFVQALRYRNESKLLAGSGMTVFLLVLVQATAGVLIVFFPDAYLTTALIHSVVISLLFTVLCYMTMIVTRNHAY